MVTPTRGLTACLREDFARFTDGLRRGDGSFRDSAVRNAYGFEFRHDFPTVDADADADADGHEERAIVDNWADFVTEVRAKYERRIARFREAMTSGRPVLFLRRCWGTTGAEVAEMLGALRARYPALECDMLVADADIPGAARIRDDPTWNSAADWAAAMEPFLHAERGTKP